MAECLTREEFECLVVLYGPIPDDPAVAMRGVLAEADIGDDDEVWELPLEGSDRLLDDPILGVALGPAFVLRLCDRGEQDCCGRELVRIGRIAWQFVDRGM